MEWEGGGGGGGGEKGGGLLPVNLSHKTLIMPLKFSDSTYALMDDKCYHEQIFPFSGEQ